MRGGGREIRCYFFTLHTASLSYTVYTTHQRKLDKKTETNRHPRKQTRPKRRKTHKATNTDKETDTKERKTDRQGKTSRHINTHKTTLTAEMFNGRSADCVPVHSPTRTQTLPTVRPPTSLLTLVITSYHSSLQ